MQHIYLIVCIFTLNGIMHDYFYTMGLKTLLQSQVSQLRLKKLMSVI